MNTYYFELLDLKYKDLGIFIPDSSSKKTAINKAVKIGCISEDTIKKYIENQKKI